jgi:hypothetical protein
VRKIKKRLVKRGYSKSGGEKMTTEEREVKESLDSVTGIVKCNQNGAEIVRKIRED